MPLHSDARAIGTLRWGLGSRSTTCIPMHATGLGGSLASPDSCIYILGRLRLGVNTSKSLTHRPFAVHSQSQSSRTLRPTLRLKPLSDPLFMRSRGPAWMLAIRLPDKFRTVTLEDGRMR